MKKFTITFCLLFTFISYAQTNSLDNKDAVTNCKIIRSGKFVIQSSETELIPGYYLVYKNGYCTEYIEGGKYYLKSQIEFDSPCSYISTTTESTIPNFDAGIGEKMYSEILESTTADHLLRVRSKIEGKEWVYFVIKKVD